MTLEQCVSQVLQDLLTGNDKLALDVQSRIEILAEREEAFPNPLTSDDDLEKAYRQVLSTLRKI